jgi:hypothetical protein
MKNKILSIMNATKKKAGVALLCGALVATIGAGTALGSNSKTSLLVKMDNGVRLYSTDSGKTWSEKAPDGVTVSDRDGKITITNGILPKDGEGKGLLSKVENGVRSYSTDSGKTWSTTAPVGAESEAGKTSFMNGTPQSGDTFGTSLQVKMENGVRLYSTDGGKTWSTKAPDGVTVSDKDGKVTIMNGTPPKDGEGKGLLSKVENGVRSYSTDGGKTWSTTAPDGVTETVDGKIGFTIGQDAN